ncbi:MAG: aminotransferase class IV [Bacteroidetes bacterium]|nr:aminotransferase class IV [Bacteroidota bacterium]
MRNISGDKFIYDDQILPAITYSPSLYEQGETLYEVTGFQNGHFFFLDDHLDRLVNSASMANLKLWLSREEIIAKFNQILIINQVKNGSVNIIFNFSDIKHCIVYYIEPAKLTEKDYSHGVPVGLLHSERLNPNIKFYNMSFRRLADKAIMDNKVTEVILVDRNGLITEGSRSNVFLVRNSEIYTPPVEDVLPGITRKHIISICKKMDINFIEKKIPLEELPAYQGLFLTGTNVRVVPVNKVENIHFQADQPLIQDIRFAYSELIMRLTAD